MILNVSKSANAGVPSSVTVTVTGYTPGPSASVGVHVNAPDAASIIIPKASESASNVKVSVSGGASGSVAEATKVNNVCSATVWVPMAASTGASLTASTIKKKSLEAIRPPLSTAMTAKRYTPTSAWAGVPLKVRVLPLKVSQPGSGLPSNNEAW